MDDGFTVAEGYEAAAAVEAVKAFAPPLPKG